MRDQLAQRQRRADADAAVGDGERVRQVRDRLEVDEQVRFEGVVPQPDQQVGAADEGPARRRPRRERGERVGRVAGR